MSPSAVAPSQRFRRQFPCPICGGGADSREGERCWGFQSADGEWAHCTRAELAGGLEPGPDESYAHRVSGDCKCGVTHAPGPERQPGPVLRVGRTILTEKDWQVGEFIHRRRDYSDGTKGFTWHRADGRSGLGGVPVTELPLYGAERLGTK